MVSAGGRRGGEFETSMGQMGEHCSNHRGQHRSFCCLATTMGWGLLGMGRNAREIAEHDAHLSRIVATIRRLYSPKDAVICHADEYYLYGLRHFQLYLPEYEQYQLAVDTTLLHHGASR